MYITGFLKQDNASAYEAHVTCYSYCCGGQTDNGSCQIFLQDSVYQSPRIVKIASFWPSVKILCRPQACKDSPKSGPMVWYLLHAKFYLDWCIVYTPGWWQVDNPQIWPYFQSQHWKSSTRTGLQQYNYELSVSTLPKIEIFLLDGLSPNCDTVSTNFTVQKRYESTCYCYKHTKIRTFLHDGDGAVDGRARTFLHLKHFRSGQYFRQGTVNLG